MQCLATVNEDGQLVTSTVKSSALCTKCVPHTWINIIKSTWSCWIVKCRTFFTLNLSWLLLENVSSSMSESPLSECSETLGAPDTLTFRVLGGKAGGRGSAGALATGRPTWPVDAAALALCKHCCTPVTGAWLTLAEPTLNGSRGLREVCWCVGEEVDGGVSVRRRGGLGLSLPSSSSGESSTFSSFKIWLDSGAFSTDLAGKGT